MITNKLTKRMKEIVNLVTGNRVADIGCDHGKIVNYLLVSGKIDYAICSDISLPSVTKAKDLLILNNVDNSKFSIRCGDGLNTVLESDNIDTAIITGMGGTEIIKILSNSKILPFCLILSPQKKEIEVKKKILNLGYEIIYDKIIFDDKFYTIIKAVKSGINQTLSDLDLHFGKDSFKNNEDFSRYLSYMEKKYMPLVARTSGTNRQNILNMLQLINLAKQKLEKIYE